LHTDNDFSGITEKLKADKLNNIQCLGFLKNVRPILVKEAGSVILVKGISDHEWTYICSAHKGEFPELTDEFTDTDKYFFTNNEDAKDYMIKHFGCKIYLDSASYYFPGNDFSFKETVEVQPVKPEEAQIIWDNTEYRDVMDFNYVKERIAAGISACISTYGKMVSWSLTHDDNSIGFLHTVEEERKKGYAINVVANMTRQMLNKGEIPFVQITESNLKSYNLAVKLGYKRLGSSFWLYR
jgi:8-oxo-dGTP diphosphatase